MRRAALLLGLAVGVAVAQEGEGPSWRLRSDSALGEPPPSLEPPPALPPRAMEDLPRSPLARAVQHVRRARALDAMAVRASRWIVQATTQGLAAEACGPVRGAWSGLVIAATEARAEALTAAALLQPLLGEAPTTGAAEAQAEAGDLLARIEEIDGRRGPLAAAMRAADCPPVPVALTAPVFALPEEDRRPVGDDVVVFVRAPEATPVLWVDGAPAAAAVDGWGALVVPTGEHRLCAAPAEATGCAAGAMVQGVMGAAFDLTAG